MMYFMLSNLTYKQKYVSGCIYEYNNFIYIFKLFLFVSLLFLNCFSYTLKYFFRRIVVKKVNGPKIKIITGQIKKIVLKSLIFSDIDKLKKNEN